MQSDLTVVARWDKQTPHEGIGTAVHQTPSLLKCVYDFSVLGGAATTTYQLLDDQGNKAIVPAKAIITRVFLDVITPCVGAGSMSLAAEATADLMAATAAASITGLVEGKQDFTAAKFVKTTVARNITTTTSVGTITAGKFYVHVEYVVGN